MYRCAVGAGVHTLTVGVATETADLGVWSCIVGVDTVCATEVVVVVVAVVEDGVDDGVEVDNVSAGLLVVGRGGSAYCFFLLLCLCLSLALCLGLSLPLG